MTDPKEKLWFVIHRGAQEGPYLGRLLVEKELPPETLVWCSDMPNWAPLHETPLGVLLFGIPPELPIPPPIPQPPPLPNAGAEPPSSDSVDSGPVNSHEEAVSVAPVTGVRDCELRPHGAAMAAQPNYQSEGRAGARNFIARHWRGDFSLARAYWINIILIGVAINLAVTALFSSTDASLRSIAFMFLGVVGVAYGIGVWQIVGLYRSLRLHEARGGSRVGSVSGWLGVAIFLGGTVWSSYVNVGPAAVGMFNIARGDTATGRLEIRLLPSGREIEIKGGLRAGSGREFQETLEKVPYAKVLHIDSWGGRVKEAFMIADSVAQRGMTTFVSGQCESAAIFIYLAGKERVASPTATFGFHAVHFPGLGAAAMAETNVAIANRMADAGVSVNFIQRGMDTPHTEMWRPDMADLIAAGVVHRVAKGDEFGMPSAYLAVFDDLEAQLLSFDVYRAIKDYDAQAFQRLVHLGKEMAESGVSLAGTIAGLRNHNIEMLGEAMRYASDEALLRYFEWELRLAEQYVDSQPLPVLRMLMGVRAPPGSIDLTALPGYPRNEEFSVVGEVFSTAVGRPIRVFDQDRLDMTLASVGERFAEEDSESALILAGDDDFYERPLESARALIKYMRFMQDVLPPERLAEIFRAPKDDS